MMLRITQIDSIKIHCSSVAKMNYMHINLLPLPGTKIKHVLALLHLGGENVIMFWKMGSGAWWYGTESKDLGTLL